MAALGWGVGEVMVSAEGTFVSLCLNEIDAGRGIGRSCHLSSCSCNVHLCTGRAGGVVVRIENSTAVGLGFESP